MRIGELLDYLKREAVKFRSDHDYYRRNAHMHAITEAPSQAVIDAVLTGFINTVGTSQSFDYALYASDLEKADAENKANAHP